MEPLSGRFSDMPDRVDCNMGNGFVTIRLSGSGGNLRLAQALTRHNSIALTQRYAHLSDDDLARGYHEIFYE